ncbi:MAG: ribosome small subunit-dependent GTPase A [Bacteroidales bacterium]
MEGTVYKSTGSWYYVKGKEGETWPCKIKGSFRTHGARTTNPVAVGDKVEFRIIPGGNKEGLIYKLHERNNYIIRKATKLSKESHIIASNIDQAIVMASLAYPETYTLFIDRFLVTTEAYSVPAKIIFNKIDLYDEKTHIRLNELMERYTEIGYECLNISATNGDNIEKVKQLLKDKRSVLAGNSGVGKSTLINKLVPELNLKIKDVSSYHKTGKHATTFAEMIELPFGGEIIDTPGIRGFGLVDFYKEEIYHYFPEIFEAAGECKFHNCLHKQEPGCNVIKQVEEGKISEDRYHNYLRILLDNDEKYR